MEGVADKNEVRSLGKIRAYELPVQNEGLEYFREHGIRYVPELQIQLIQEAEFKHAGKKLDRAQLENIKPKIDEILANDATQQALIRQKLPPGSPPYGAIVVGIDVIHMPHSPEVKAHLKVRVHTDDGFIVAVRNEKSPTNKHLLEKMQKTTDRFKGLIGSTIAIYAQESKNGRLFLSCVHSSLPEEFRAKADK